MKTCFCGSRCRRVVFSAAVLLGTAGAMAQSCSFSVDAAAVGYYDAGGNHTPGSNYLAGDVSFGPGPMRNFFVFNMPAMAGPALAASIYLQAGYVRSSSNEETYTIFDVATPPATLSASQSNARAIYDDLGSGTAYGSVTIPTNQVFQTNGWVMIDLSSNVLAKIGRAGGAFAIGGAVTSLDDIPGNDEYVFGQTVAGYSARIARLIVTTSPLITGQPLSRAVGEGTVLLVPAQGCADDWQWYRDGAPLSGKTNLLLAVTNVTPADAGSYSIVGHTGPYAVTSAVATVTVYATPPGIAIQPQSVSAIYGATFWLTAGASGAPWPTVQWYHNGLALAGETDGALHIVSLNWRSQGDYVLVASNYLGMATSHVATVTGLPAAILQQPDSHTYPIGAHFYIPLSYTSAVPTTVQWRRNGAATGWVNNWYEVVYAQPSDSGDYDAVLSNIYGSVTSAVAHIEIVVQAPEVTVYGPTNRSILRGRDLLISASANGGPPPVLQWYFNAAPIPGATNTELRVYNVRSDNAGDYFVVASNPSGSATSAVVAVTAAAMVPSASITASGVNAVEGDVVRIPVAADGAPYPTFQWYFNNEPIPGAMSQSLLFTAGTASTGDYSVVATNPSGSTTSAVNVVVRPRSTLEQWTWRNPLPQGNNLRSVAYGNGTYVAVGRHGSLITSTNGIDWTSGDLMIDINFSRVVFGNGRFVALGVFDTMANLPETPYVPGALVTSTDAVHWVFEEPTSIVTPTAVAFLNGLFLVSGWTYATNVGLAISTNATDWTAVRSPVAFQAMAHGNGKYLGVFGGFGAISTDATNWSQVSVPGWIYDVTFGGGIFLALGGLQGAVVSSDGVNWGTVPAPLSFSGVTWADDRFIAVAGDQIFDSRDGTNWTARAIVTGSDLMAVGASATRVVAAGNQGIMLYSDDRVNWHAPSSGTNTLALYGLTFAQDQFVAAGYDGAIFSSSNGTAWARQASGTTRDLHHVSYGNGLYVAVGKKGTLLTSPDAGTWTARVSGTTNYLLRAVYANKSWFAVGENATMLLSSNGITWTARPMPMLRTSAEIDDVAYGDGVYMAIAGWFDDGAHSELLTSTDGFSWGSLWVDLEKMPRGVAFGNGMFVVVANDGRICYVQSDLRVPATVDIGTENLRAVTYAGGRFVTVGNNATMYSSCDGVTWKRQRVLTGDNLHAAAFGVNSFVVVGNDGLIMQSGPVLAELAQLRAGQGGALSLSVRPGADDVYRLQSSPDLTHWSDVLTFTNGNKGITATNSAAGQSGFYRVVGQ